jgi:RND family efflux transporter MFP subunit
MRAPRAITSAPRALAAAAMLIAAPAFGAALDCLVEPTQAIDVGAPVSGLLERVHVRRGDRVAKGQVLATLESNAEQAAAELARYKSQALGPTLTAQSKIEFARRKFERRAQMVSEKLMSAQDRDDAEGELKLAEAELQVAKESRQIAAIEHQQQASLLNLRTLRSPLDGVVVDQLLYPGEVVEISGNKKTILKLAQLDPLRVHVVLPMAAFRKISPGMAAKVRLEAPIGGTYAAKVRTVDKLIDAASGTFAAFLEMRNADLAIPAGVKCTAEFAVLEPSPAASSPAAR